MKFEVTIADGTKFIATLLVESVEEGGAALSFLSSGTMYTFKSADVISVGIAPA